MLQAKHRRLNLPHKSQIVGRDNHRRSPALVQLKEQPHQARAHLRVDIARRLIRNQDVRLGHHGAGDGHALLFATRKRGWARMHPLT